MRRLTCLAALLCAAFALGANQRVACVGDERLAPDYAPVLQRALAPWLVVSEESVGGATVASAPSFQRTRASLPDVVVITLGAGDLQTKSWSVLRDRFVPACRDLVRSIQAWPSHPTVVLCTPRSVDVPEGRRAALAAELTPLMRQAGREIGFTVIDLTSCVSAADVADEVQVGAGLTGLLKAGWKLVDVSSEQPGEEPAAAAIDGNPETYWHTRYEPNTPKPPHSITFDIGGAYWLSGFTYLPRQDGGSNGNVKDYEVHVSPDGQAWTLAAKGAWASGQERKLARFARPIHARYVRFVALSEAAGGAWASAAELDVVLAAPPSGE